MFYKCSSLISLPDISKWNINNVKNLSYIPDDCFSSQSINSNSLIKSKYSTKEPSHKKTSRTNFNLYKENNLGVLLNENFITGIIDINNYEINNYIEIFNTEIDIKPVFFLYNEQINLIKIGKLTINSKKMEIIHLNY